MEVPGHGLVKAEWDLRPKIDDYLGNVDFRGKRALDVGAASGYLSFHMEQRGAEVVSYDLCPEIKFEAAPSRYGYRRHIEAYREYIRRINNGYWFTHRALKSRAKVVYGTVYKIPKAVGPVDVSVFGSILLHLRDPFLALQNAARLTTERNVVADLLWLPGDAHEGPHMVFIPDYWKAEQQGTWWRLTPAIVQQFLASLGFEKLTTNYHDHPYHGNTWQMFTVVGERTQPREDFGLDD
jgi:SAM-dependent methyltransferase